MGVEVPVPLLQTVTALPETDLQTCLDALRTAEFLYESRFVPDQTYAFTHVLVQEVAAQSLLRPARQQLHQYIAQVLTAHFPDLAAAQPERLAHHYAEAGWWEPAIDVWQQAGQRAVDRCAYTEALALAQSLTHPYSLVQAHYWAAFLHQRRRDAPAVQAQAEALLTLAAAQGFPLWVSFGACWRGWALAMQGAGAASLAPMHQGLTTILATGQTLSQALCLVLLAEAAGHTGQVDAGLRLLAEALAAFTAGGRGDLLAEAYRLQGTLLMQQACPDAAQAEACFQQALAVARRQQARTWELRAAISLGHLWQQHGEQQAAYDLLASLAGWFTEGLDTADLLEARALLMELAP
jgi:predicted ATPase